MHPTPRLRVQRFVVEQIFGEGSHDVVIDLDLEGRVTVVHGRNGGGKTLTLAMLGETCALKADTFARLPATRLVLELTEGVRLELAKGHRPRDLPLRIAQGDAALGTAVLSIRPQVGVGAGSSEPRRHQPGSWLTRSLDTGEVLPGPKPAGSDAEAVAAAAVATAGSVAVLSQILRRLPLVRNVQTDRLHVRGEAGSPAEGDAAAGPRLMVDQLSHQLHRALERADTDYRQRSTELDSTLHRRLFARSQGPLDRAKLDRRARRVTEDEADLFRLGLLAAQPDPLWPIPEADDDLRVLQVILTDREDKLTPFAALSRKAKLLIASLNQKLAPKQIKLDLTKGYSLLSAAGAALPLACLSSGEQHELVLLHELLFETEPGTLVLIDEPELSLHVTWQRDLTREVRAIALEAGVDFVLATHSPYIVGDQDPGAGGPHLVRLGPAA